MTDEMRAAWIEACAKALDELPHNTTSYGKATAALSVLGPLIEADVAERCARLALSQASVLRARGNTSLIGEGMLLVRAMELESLASAIRNAFPAKGEG